MTTWTTSRTFETGRQVTTLYAAAVAADVAAEVLPATTQGTYLYQVEVKSSADTSIAVSVNSALGAALYTLTSGDYRTANIGIPTAFYWIHEGEAATWTLSGLGSGTVAIKMTFVSK